MVQTKKFFFCLVDEADSILIDEARTPLIISRSVDAPAQKFATSQKVAMVLEKGLHYTVSIVIKVEPGFACQLCLVCARISGIIFVTNCAPPSDLSFLNWQRFRVYVSDLRLQPSVSHTMLHGCLCSFA